MAVTILFKNLDRPLPVREQLDGLAAESAGTHAPLILQRLEAGQ